VAAWVAALRSALVQAGGILRLHASGSKLPTVLANEHAAAATAGAHWV
jgi:hypothetical protein